MTEVDRRLQAIATVSLIATAILAYRQTRLQARLTTVEQTRQRKRLRHVSTPTYGQQ